MAEISPHAAGPTTHPGMADAHAAARRPSWRQVARWPLATYRQPAAGRLHLTVGEALVAALLWPQALIVICGYTLDVLRIPLSEHTFVPVVLIVVALSGAAALRLRLIAVRLDIVELAGLAFIALALAGYLAWFSGRALLPASFSPDAVHHLLLVNAIRSAEHLPRWPALWAQLGEMSTYPAGSHLLVVFYADLLSLPGYRAIGPVTLGIVVSQAALTFLLAYRLLPAGEGRLSRMVLSCLAVGLLLLPIGKIHSVNPANFFTDAVLRYDFFYSSVASIMFLLYTVWFLVLFRQHMQTWLLAPMTLSIAACVLSWPILGLIPASIFALSVFSDGRISWRVRVSLIGSVGLVLILIAAAYIIRYGVKDQGVLTSEGGIQTIALNSRSLIFFVLALIGAAESMRRRSYAVVFFFLAVVLVLYAVMKELAHHGTIATYIAEKVPFVLVFPLALFAAVGIQTLARAAARLIDSRRPIMPAVLTAGLGLLCVSPGIHAIDRHRERPFTTALYDTGHWSRLHLPPDSVGFLTAYGSTAYWLQTDVLGNPRVVPRSVAVVGEISLDSSQRWPRELAQPYIIIENLALLPPQLRSDFAVLYQSGASAVLGRKPAGN
ncbi:MAG TPA: hypothetical protein VKV26_21625 [Dehalococcoidia bacterium]|nr:hypothetical protein [Dehalococcoidia bacterium]